MVTIKRKYKIIINIIILFLIVIISLVALVQYKQQANKKTNYINLEMTNHYLYLYDASNTFNSYLNNNNPLSLIRTIDNLYNSSMSYEKAYDLKNPHNFGNSDVNLIVKELSRQIIVLFGNEEKQDELEELKQINEFLAKWVEWIEEEQSSVLNGTTVYNYYESLDFSATIDNPEIKRLLNLNKNNN